MLWSTQIYGYVKKNHKSDKKPPSDVLIGISCTRYYDGKKTGRFVQWIGSADVPGSATTSALHRCFNFKYNN